VLPANIDVTTVAAGQRPLDGYLTGPGGTDGASLLAVPIRRPDVIAAKEAANDAAPDGWADLTGTGGTALTAATGLSAAEAISAYDLSGRAGEVTRLAARTPDGVIRLVLLGVGDGSPADLRRAGAALARQVEPGQRAVAVLPSDGPGDGPGAFTQGLLLGGYTFSLRDGATVPDPAPEPRTVLLAVPDQQTPAQHDGTQEATVIAAAVALARDLINMPSDVKTPSWLAARAVEVAGRSGLSVRMRDEAELAAAGFGGIVAVGSGSAHPPRLIELSYRPDSGAAAGPADAAQAHVVLAGKGITFDSGGLSLKPNDGMKLMKTDMAGGAVVIAVMSALRALGVRARVTGLVAAAENMPSGSAMRPGDIITIFGGRTVEVLNTDAEGRLVLADLLAYAQATLSPGVIVDLATLTGAARIALGASIGALYASADELAETLTEAGAAAGEPLWRMPMPADYAMALTSATADLAHIPSGMNGAKNGQAGSIVAAMFLREFTGGRRWAHLDIAGAAWAGSDDGELTKGGTGFGTRLLLRWLTQAGEPQA
jgi:leucyl aminopeptidase